MQYDFFSQWMGVKILDVKDGYSKIQITLRKEMLNGFAIAHGGDLLAGFLIDGVDLDCGDRRARSVGDNSGKPSGGALRRNTRAEGGN